MMVLFFRILFVIAPIVVLFLYIRWRAAKKREGQNLTKELSHLRYGLLAMVVLMLVAGVGIRLADDDKGKPGATYVPPHMENGKIIPGKFEDKKPEESDSQKDDKSR